MYATKNQRVALIIIDMQQGMATEKAGERNNPQAEASSQWFMCVISLAHPNRLFGPGRAACYSSLRLSHSLPNISSIKTCPMRSRTLG